MCHWIRCGHASGPRVGGGPDAESSLRRERYGLIVNELLVMRGIGEAGPEMTSTFNV